ncbi:TlpA family protein disulfide reductase [Schnuerera sp. xch1]|nr:TlpA family protein disulfide reductase [Schnuerera sp. xch1]
MKRRDIVNRKILAIIIAVVVLAVGLYYFTIGKDEKPNENNLSEENVSEENDSETDSETSDEGMQDKKASDEITPDIAIGEEAPDFTLLNLDGEEVSLSDYRGKYVLVNFWYTGCQYCDMEMPDLQRLYDENDDLMVLAVNVMEEKSIVEDYIKEGKYSFPVVFDEEGEIAGTYLVSGFPTSYFVDKEGNLLGGIPGMMTYEQMNQILDDFRKDE